MLQTDPNPYYGSNEAALSLDDLEKWAQNPPAGFSFASCKKQTAISRPRAYTLTLAPHIIYWGSNLLDLLRNVDMTTSFTWQAVGSWWVYLTDEDVLLRSEGGGGIGGALVDAGVKAMKAGGTIRKKGGWNKGRKSRDPGPALDTPEEEVLPELAPRSADSTSLRKLGGVLREVPCTFEDVAWSEDLKDRDRGYLGGFLRFITKCANPDDTKHHQLLVKNAETSLTEFITANYPLPPFTIASLHSLTLLPTPPEKTPLRLAIPALTRHLSSVGRIPDIRSSAALTIAYGGSAELCQVWSRGAAVAGGLNVLERGITSITPSGPKLSVRLSNDETITADWVVTSRSSTPTGAPTKPSTLTKGIFVITAPLESLFSKKFTEDRITPNAAVLTFPTGSLTLVLEGKPLLNEFPVYIIAHSAATGECVDGESVLYTSTLQSQPAGYAFAELAVRRVIAACSDKEAPAEVAFVCRYTQESPTPPNAGIGYERGVLSLAPMLGELAFEEDVVEECKCVYERIMGTREGFLEMGEEMRRQYALQDEEE